MSIAILLQRLAQLRMVINFTVEHQHEALIGAGHGLVPLLGQVLNGQPNVTKRYAIICIFPEAMAVGPAVGNPATALRQQRFLVFEPAYQPDNPAHSGCLSLW